MSLEEQTENTGFDMDGAVDSIGADLFGPSTDATVKGADGAIDDDLNLDDDPSKSTAADPDALNNDTSKTGVEADAAVDAQKTPMPQSWKKDMAPVWEKMDPAAQKYYVEREKQMLDGITQDKDLKDYGRSLKSVIDPYLPVIQAQGLDAPKAVQSLLNAHYRLSTGTPEERQAYFATIAKSYGIKLPAAGAESQDETPLPPAVQAALDKVNRFESAMTEQQRQQYEQTRVTTAKEVEAFASDPAHAYFDEVADDIVALLKTGAPLKDAYEKAVWANPVTRQKEIARIQTETNKANREKAQEAARKAKKGISTNVRGRDTTRAPTEPAGTMDDTLRETMAEIKTRVTT